MYFGRRKVVNPKAVTSSIIISYGTSHFRNRPGTIFAVIKVLDWIIVRDDKKEG